MKKILLLACFVAVSVACLAGEPVYRDASLFPVYGKIPDATDNRLVCGPVEREYMLYLSLYDGVSTLEIGTEGGCLIDSNAEKNEYWAMRYVDHVFPTIRKALGRNK